MQNLKTINMPRIYISGAMRSGSSLISGILNGNSKIKILDKILKMHVNSVKIY